MTATVTAPVINTAALTYRRAKKTKGIKAKPLQHLLTDQGVLAKFLLDTIEGHQALKANSIVCLGINGEAWQQKKQKLFQQYTVTDLTDDGWWVCEPKPDVERNAVEVTPNLCDEAGNFSVVAQWGTETLLEGCQVFLQFGQANDILCKNPDDATDVWIVRRKEFDATQEFVS